MLTANNITIYSAGNIVLFQQTTALTQLATAVPVAVFSPGGMLTVFAGETLSADGGTATTRQRSSRRSASATTPATGRLARNRDAVASVTAYTWFCRIYGHTACTTPPTVTFAGGGGSGAYRQAPSMPAAR